MQRSPEEAASFPPPQTLGEMEGSVPDSLVDWYLNPDAPSPVTNPVAVPSPVSSAPAPVAPMPPAPLAAAPAAPAAPAPAAPPPAPAGAMPAPPAPPAQEFPAPPAVAPAGAPAPVPAPMPAPPAAAAPAPPVFDDLPAPPGAPTDFADAPPPPPEEVVAEPVAAPVTASSGIFSDEMRELKRRAQDSLIERLGNRLYDATVDESDLERNVIEELANILVEEAAMLSADQLQQLSESLINDILGHGAIEPLLKDDAVSEIMVNNKDMIYIEKNGKLRLSGVTFESEEALRQVIDRIVSRIGRRVDESSPMVDARLPDGSRVNAIIPPLAVDGSSLTIRKFAKKALVADDLVKFGTLTPESVMLLQAFVDGKLNILVSGGTGSGKTTLLNVLSNFIPDDERIVTIEDAVELRINKPHVVRLESRPPNLEGRGAVTIRDLVKNSLRMRPDRIVVGECRGSEALDMLQAMNTGHDGSLSTLHANTPRDAISRTEIMVMMGGMDLPIMAIREQIASAVDLIVQLSRLRDGTRRVTHITEIVGMEGDTVTLSDIFVFDYDGVDADGKYIGELRPTGLRPMILEKLADHGIELPSSVFGSAGGAADLDFKAM